jgi:hypothetical protein
MVEMLAMSKEKSACSRSRRQLAGRLVRERDREDLLDRQFPDEQELQDEVLEGVGLARAGGGLDDSVAIRRNPRERLGLLVARGFRRHFTYSAMRRVRK